MPQMFDFDLLKQKMDEPTRCCYWCSKIVDFNGMWKCKELGRNWQKADRFETVCDKFTMCEVEEVKEEGELK